MYHSINGVVHRFLRWLECLLKFNKISIVSLHAWEKMRMIRTSRAAVFVRVFQTLEVTIKGSIITSPFIPRTSFLARIFQTLEVTFFGSILTSPFIPRTSVLARVFQTLEVTIFSSTRTSRFIPRTSVFAQKFERL